MIWWEHRRNLACHDAMWNGWPSGPTTSVPFLKEAVASLRCWFNVACVWSNASAIWVCWNMATIYDVASQAGVSVKTVSRVMNNYPHVSDKTRGKVLETMDALNYAPSQIAQQMRRPANNSIGMLYSDPGSEYQAKLNHSILRACVDARRYLAVQFFDEAQMPWADQVAKFIDGTGVKSMILVPPLCDSVEVHALLRENGIRFVLISPSQPVSGASAVAMDDRLAAREITEKLIEAGHKQIAHIAGDERHVVTLLRQSGYEDAMTNAAPSLAQHIQVAKGSFDFKKALQCADEMLSGDGRPTAVFAANDHMALAVIMAAHRRGLSIPADLSVAGFDDTPMGQAIWPPLATVAQPFDLIADKAVRLLADTPLKSEGLFATHILPHALVLRESLGPVPSEPK